MKIREQFQCNSFPAKQGVAIQVCEKRAEIIAITEVIRLHTKISPMNTITVMYKHSSTWAKTQGFSHSNWQNLCKTTMVTRGSHNEQQF